LAAEGVVALVAEDVVGPTGVNQRVVGFVADQRRRRGDSRERHQCHQPERRHGAALPPLPHRDLLGRGSLVRATQTTAEVPRKPPRGGIAPAPGVDGRTAAPGLQLAAMAYDERLADELRDILRARDAEPTEKRMFGGLAFMVEGNLTVAASRTGGLLVRTDPDEAA